MVVRMMVAMARVREPNVTIVTAKAPILGIADFVQRLITPSLGSMESMTQLTTLCPDAHRKHSLPISLAFLHLVEQPLSSNGSQPDESKAKQ